jgi:hypothetical protein
MCYKGSMKSKYFVDIVQNALQFQTDCKIYSFWLFCMHLA